MNPLYPSLPRSAGKAVPVLSDDFAVFRKEAGFRAESPEGTRVRLGGTRNTPQGDAAFWQKALIFHLGPRYRMAEPLESGAFRGVLFTSKDSKPYAYLVAVRVQQKKLIVLEAFFPDDGGSGPTPRHREVRPERPGGRLMEARLKIRPVPARPALGRRPGRRRGELPAPERGGHHAGRRPQGGSRPPRGLGRGRGGYTLYKSDERVSLRLPHPRLGGLRGFLEKLSEDILEYSPQAVDLREQLARAQSSLASRRDILARNLALLDQADTAGTLAIEQELLDQIQEVENLQAAVQKLTVDRTFARVEIGLRFEQSALPEDIPSSFAWINEVSFRPFD